MDRKAIARETLDIMGQGYYELPVAGQEMRKIDISQDMEWSIKKSILITPAQGEEIRRQYGVPCSGREEFKRADTVVENIATVGAVRKLASQGKTRIGVLNFASAKNPGGGFLNGAMAQEESLAASGTLYRTLTVHEDYYRENRACRSMIYTNYGIYSPEVVFFRDGNFCLAEPVKASVLTLPAVNMGQVIQKGEDMEEARKAMRQRMELALCVFASQGAKNLVLGAYGCGVFRNDPAQVAMWWKELLEGRMERYFDSVFYAVMDRSKGQGCINAFYDVFSDTRIS